jgi:hypothetical protein
MALKLLPSTKEWLPNFLLLPSPHASTLTSLPPAPCPREQTPSPSFPPIKSLPLGPVGTHKQKTFIGL